MSPELPQSSSEVSPKQKEKQRPLIVDLDTCLLLSNPWHEAIIANIRQKPWSVFRIPFWALQGRTYLNRLVYEQAEIDVKVLPYQQELLAMLTDEKRRGRTLILASSAHQTFARKVSDHLQIFDETFSSNGSLFLHGSRRAEYLLERFGSQGFDYVGSRRSDFNCWQLAARTWILSNDRQFQLSASQQGPVEKLVSPPRKSLKRFAKALRLHHWSKNILIFIPLLLSSSVLDAGLWLRCLLAFFAYSCISSSVYILNDLLDLEADRRHPENRFRPFASGSLSIAAGLITSPALLMIGLGLSAALSEKYFAIVLGYFVMTCLYSLRLKLVVMADIIVLAFLYTWRVFAGGVVAGIAISEWLLNFALFFFMSLAFLKRCSELIVMEQSKQNKSSRRAYLVSDLPLLLTVGVANAYLSVLVLALYIHDSSGASHMRHPEVLWLLCPMLLYWLSRIWLKAYRGVIHTDPLVFTLKDKTTYILGACAGILWFLANGSFTLH